MIFIASLKSGSKTASMGRARNLQSIHLGGLVFAWNGRQYKTEILPDIPKEILNHPQVLITTMGSIASPLEIQERIDPIPLNLNNKTKSKKDLIQ